MQTTTTGWLGLKSNPLSPSPIRNIRGGKASHPGQGSSTREALTEPPSLELSLARTVAPL
jgi:hypothetical protein